MPIETRFLCKAERKDFITIDSNKEYQQIQIKVHFNNKFYANYILDIPTAIKLSKTIRTHINLVKSNKNEQ